MKRSSHPRRECACESRRAGASQARFEKKVPEKGDENSICSKVFLDEPFFEKKVPEKGDENYSQKYA